MIVFNILKYHWIVIIFNLESWYVNDDEKYELKLNYPTN
jgi:hypothetical protein